MELLFHILTMINVGFIEEVVFRVFLFKMMEKYSVKGAIIVSSITFGIGHINLLNGADLIPKLLQFRYAILIGFFFVIIFYKSKSLNSCIVAHAIMNSLSIYIVLVFLIFVPIIYSMYIIKCID